jgi:radical SAM superfamily enzyme YgiQ (UPF0313 family)
LSRRILIVNAFFSGARPRRPTTVLRAMGPPFLAGAFDPRACTLDLHDEQTGGPLASRERLGSADMLVLTGLTSAFDRMLQLAAYARTLNPHVRVVAGGPAVRALPKLSARFFDYVCEGDVEEMRAVVADAFGRDHASDEMVPRFDLAPWIKRVGHVEASRNCNFHCSFCSLTAERRAIVNYDSATVRRQLDALGPRAFAVFIDNNFYGQHGAAFRARLDLAREYRDRGWFKGFGALVTSDFFFDENVVRAARAAGLEAVYCGIESFERERLEGYDKHQNTQISQVEVMRRAFENGIVLTYGLIVDPSARRLDRVAEEIDFVLSSDRVALPAMFTLSIPYPGTPFFDECVRERRLLPRTRISNLDGKTLTLRPIDDLGAVARFVRDLQTMRGRRARVARHTAAFLLRHRRFLSARQLAMVASRAAALAGAFGAFTRALERTYVSTSEPLHDEYRPMLPVAARYARNFQPTWLTDERGDVADELREDLSRADGARRVRTR